MIHAVLLQEETGIPQDQTCLVDRVDQTDIYKALFCTYFLAANILMDCVCLNIKLADFGSCVDLRSMETSGRPLRLAGTLAFMAPEVGKSI